MLRIAIASVVGGLVMFAWSAVAHLALPIGRMGLSKVPNQESFLAGLRTTLPASGLYMFPAAESDAPTDQELETLAAKAEAGPSGFLAYRRSGGSMVTPGKLALELATNIAAAFLAAAVLARKPGTWLCRALGVGALGVFAWLSITASQWIWDSFPSAFVLGGLLEQGIGWTLAGAAIAFLAPKGECKA